MKIKMAVLPLSILMGCSCLGLTNEGRQLKTMLQLTDFNGPTNRYTWVCPPSVAISNQTFRTSRIDQRDKLFEFDLLRTDGLAMASCEIEMAKSSEEALDMICDRIVMGCTAPIQGVGTVWRVERDEKGNVLLESRSWDENGSVGRDRSLFYRTYGNLYIRVAINAERTTLGAWDFAIPLVNAGLQTR